jgi:hypothetical protein
VQGLVEANYVKGKPLHHFPAARSIEYQPGASIFFIIDHLAFEQLSKAVKSDLHRHRNIVVRNCPQRSYVWSPDTLSLVGGYEEDQEIQGTYLFASQQYLACSIINSG